MKPLEGITILSFHQILTLTRGVMLAEQGARVIKVEPSDSGTCVTSGTQGRRLLIVCRPAAARIDQDRSKTEAGQAVVRDIAHGGRDHP